MTRSRLFIFLCAVISVLGALAFEWIISPFVGSVLPPLAVLTTTAWFFVLPMPWRLSLGGAIGFFLDSVSLPPFGAAMVLFLFLSLAVEALETLLADRDSYAAKAAVFVVLVVLILLFAPLARIAAGHVYAISS